MNLYTVLLYGSLITIGISGLCILSGVIFIKLCHRERHKWAMLSASFFALIFVGLYMARTSIFPHTKYEGNFRGIYFATLWSHTFLSVVNFPMAVMTLYSGLKGRFERHKKIAPYTAGIWLYVAATGWLIYFFQL
ncbi:MAG: hypothetical protein A2132_03535 [Nitrospirae bacterium RBG_16_43_11]|nr:MAG: hypothetical protein A2132_03535 [Nitrospirae bacterium RBG_16_43_11]